MTTYYVATENGNNLAQGGASSPWRTINYALQADLKPGDEIVVRAGTYNELVLVRKDGAVGEYITVRLEGARRRQDRSPRGPARRQHQCRLRHRRGLRRLRQHRLGHHRQSTCITSRWRITSSTTTTTTASILAGATSSRSRVTPSTVTLQLARPRVSISKRRTTSSGDMTTLRARITVANNVVYDNVTAEGQPQDRRQRHQHR